MTGSDTFQFSEHEARRMRRGVYLFPLIILPFVAVFGLDASKSQPVHFIIVLTIGVMICSVFIGIHRIGVREQIRNARNTLLTVSADRLIWSGNMGNSELLLGRVTAATVELHFGRIRSVKLNLDNNSSMTLAGYERMDELVEILQCRLQPISFKIRKWLLV
jgi:hypothetical protein